MPELLLDRLGLAFYYQNLQNNLEFQRHLKVDNSVQEIFLYGFFNAFIFPRFVKGVGSWKWMKVRFLIILIAGKTWVLGDSETGDNKSYCCIVNNAATSNQHAVWYSPLRCILFLELTLLLFVVIARIRNLLEVFCDNFTQVPSIRIITIASSVIIPEALSSLCHLKRAHARRVQAWIYIYFFCRNWSCLMYQYYYVYVIFHPTVCTAFLLTVYSWHSFCTPFRR